MHLVVTLEDRCAATPDGTIWTLTPFAFPFWSQYLEVFDGVKIVVRVRQVAVAQPGSKQVNGVGVAVIALPHYLGPWQYLMRARQAQQIVRDAIALNDAVLMRIPGQGGALFYGVLA